MVKILYLDHLIIHQTDWKNYTYNQRPKLNNKFCGATLALKIVFGQID